jgi:hypothetical protein
MIATVLLTLKVKCTCMPTSHHPEHVRRQCNFFIGLVAQIEHPAYLLAVVRIRQAVQDAGSLCSAVRAACTACKHACDWLRQMTVHHCKEIQQSLHIAPCFQQQQRRLGRWHVRCHLVQLLLRSTTPPPCCCNAQEHYADACQHLS